MSTRRPALWLPPLALVSLVCLVSCLSPAAAPERTVGTTTKRVIKSGGSPAPTSTPTGAGSTGSTASPTPTGSPPASAKPSPSATPTAAATPTASPTGGNGLGPLYSDGVTFSTWVGNGTEGDVDANGKDARFKWVDGIARDSHGTLFVAEEGNADIREVTPSGDVSTLKLSASSTAQVSVVRTVAFDAQDNLYVEGVNSIVKITPQGIASRFAGTGEYATAPLDGPVASATIDWAQGIAVAPNGDVYFTEYVDGVRKISNGQITTIAGGTQGATIDKIKDGTGSQAVFCQPAALAFDKDGNLLVGDVGYLRRVTPAGVVTTVKDDTGKTLDFPVIESICTDAAGNIYLGTWDGLYELTPANHLLELAPHEKQGFVDGKGTNAMYTYPSGLVIDPQGVLYMSDHFNDCIRKITLPSP